MRLHVRHRRCFLFIVFSFFLLYSLYLLHIIKKSIDHKHSFHYLINKEKINLSKSKSRLSQLLKVHEHEHEVKPPTNYEEKRQELRFSIDKFWCRIKSKLQENIDKKDSIPKSSFTELLAVGCQLHNSILATFDSMIEEDGYQTFREKEALDLSSLIQKRLFDLQNPKNCSSNKKLLCNLNIDCGFGCQLHHVVYCLIVAYGTKRTLLLDTKDWNYGDGAFEKMFEPVSGTCQIPKKYRTKKIKGKRRASNDIVNWWPGDKNDEYIKLPRMRDMKKKPDFLPPALPSEFADRIISFHGDPVVWWIGQFLKYILRPTQDTMKYLKRNEPNYGDVRHHVGIHIRRTDKLEREANFYTLETYMNYVKEYFEYADLKYINHSKSKPIYIASDDPEVFLESRTKYPEYTFVGDESRARSASTGARYNANSLEKLFMDVYMLSKSEFIVCTFSSNLCRLAYEIQQQRVSGDNHWRFKSLDDMWQFNIKWNTRVDHHQEAILPHVASQTGEMNLNPGDILDVENNMWNGYAKGKNIKNQKTGYYPLYKTKERLKKVEFPPYESIQT